MSHRKICGRHARNVVLIALFAVACLWMVHAAAEHSQASPPDAKNTPQNTPDADSPAAILDEALATARTIEDVRTKASALSRVAAGQAIAGFLEQAQKTFSEAVDEARRIEDVDEKSVIVKNIVSAQADMRLFSAALNTARGIAEEPSHLCTIATAQAEAGLFTEALGTSQKIEDNFLKARALWEIAGSQAKEGLVEQARKSFNAALAAARHIDTDPKSRFIALNQLAVAEVQAGFFAEALTAEQVGGNFYDSISRMVAAAKVKAGRADEARRSLPELVVAARAINDNKYKSEALCEIAAIQVGLGLKDDACKTFAEAIATARSIEDPEERASDFTTVGWAQTKQGMLDQAGKTFAQALTAAHEIESAEARVWEVCRIAAGQAAAGLSSNAYATARGIEDMEWCSIAFYEITVAQVDAGLTKNAQRTCQEVIAWASGNDAMRNQQVLHYIAIAQAKAGLFSGAIATARRVEDWDCKVPTLCVIVGKQTEAGFLDAALRATQEIRDPARKVSALCEIAAAKAKAEKKNAEKGK